MAIIENAHDHQAHHLEHEIRKMEVEASKERSTVYIIVAWYLAMIGGILWFCVK